MLVQNSRDTHSKQKVQKIHLRNVGRGQYLDGDQENLEKNGTTLKNSNKGSRGIKVC